jgi:sugar lactone lactonase YvrE
MSKRPETLLDGLCFPEGPRWRPACGEPASGTGAQRAEGERGRQLGKLWFSDMHAGRVMTVDLDGRAETIVEVAGEPSGLGWLPDGRLLVVSMQDRRLLRLDPGGLTEVADLTPFASYHCNDMVVDGRGRAYVGNFGFDFHARAEMKLANLALVHPDGRAQLAASELLFPNGMVITPDGRTLVVGESFATRLTAFEIAGDGTLAKRRVWAQLDKAVPDGICLDAEGAIWVASPVGHEVLRVREGGAVVQRIAVATRPIACMLGGPERRTLFLCTAKSFDPPETRAERAGRIEVVEVEVPGAGWP